MGKGKTIDLGDIGNFEMPDIDLSMVNFMPTDITEESRYTKPVYVQQESWQVMYENAEKLAKDMKVKDRMRIDAFVSGNFIFGDFIEAFLRVHNARAKEMTITTLSLSQDNVDSLAGLLEDGYIGNLNLVVSSYFWANERNSLIPYIYEHLDIDDRFQLAVASIHTKTVNMLTEGGKHIVVHGSANLRSSGNIEEFTIEENPRLYEFYDEKFKLIIEKYKTINHDIRHKKLWNCMCGKE